MDMNSEMNSGVAEAAVLASQLSHRHLDIFCLLLHWGPYLVTVFPRNGHRTDAQLFLGVTFTNVLGKPSPCTYYVAIALGTMCFSAGTWESGSLDPWITVWRTIVPKIHPGSLFHWTRQEDSGVEGAKPSLTWWIYPKLIGIPLYI